MSAAFRRWSRTVRPGCSCTTTRATQDCSSANSPMRSTRWWPTRTGPASTATQDASVASKNSHGRISPNRLWRSTEKCLPRRYDLAGDALEFVTESGRLFGRQFDDESPAALQWYPHHDRSEERRVGKEGGWWS